MKLCTVFDSSMLSKVEIRECMSVLFERFHMVALFTR
ncbi:hypothetical protein PR048_018656 [Dryococelus australis]|uniref:Uncharacterized protein n=1 Tax=Dryococelus australis TaxID=614101 RepID=A0ABQ9HCX9_9NEOP|nr:hypothetical protein PR048_018656 [Dryococelus australis]